MTTPRRLRAATRGSRLALWQTSHIASLLGVEVETVVVQTTGDRNADVPIEALGGQGVFVKEVQHAVLDGRADFAVHSAKDLPSVTVTAGLTIAAIPERGDPRDALAGSRLDDLRAGARIATGSVRRRVQLAHLRPDLTFTGLRGNVDTRLGKIPAGGAIVVAAAALERLGRVDEAAEILDTRVLIPQVGQGALAVECREDDEAALEMLAAIEHDESRKAVDAERSFLATAGGACDLPLAAYATVGADGTISIDSLVASPDGRIVVRAAAQGDDAVDVGREVARRLLDESGGRTILG